MMRIKGVTTGLLKRIKESLSVERQNLNQLKEENEKLRRECDVKDKYLKKLSDRA